MNESLRIAVADDEADMRDWFERILPTLGHQVVSVAENGRELVEHCRTLNPDLAITDVKMPEMDGIDAAQAAYERLGFQVQPRGFHRRLGTANHLMIFDKDYFEILGIVEDTDFNAERRDWLRAALALLLPGHPVLQLL